MTDDLFPGDRPSDVIDDLIARKITEAAPVAHWPCSSCRAPVEVTDVGMHAFEATNRILVRRGELPLREDGWLLCPTCAVSYREAQRKNSARVDARVRAYCAILADRNSPAHLLGEAETYVAKHASEGSTLVFHFADRRREATAKASTAVTGRRITYRREDQ